MILSIYEENNPYLRIFKDAEKNLSEQNKKKNKNKNKIDNTGVEMIKPTLKRNLFSASILPISDNIININDKSNKFDPIDVNQKNYKQENHRKIIFINK